MHVDLSRPSPDLAVARRGDHFERGLRRLASRLELSPIFEPSKANAIDIADGRLEGIVLKDRRSTYREVTRHGWWKVKVPRWYKREAWRFDRRWACPGP